MPHSQVDMSRGACQSAPRQPRARASARGSIPRVRQRALGIVVLLALALGAPGSAARCLRYEPARVTLVGVLSFRTVPGPPNYTSVARGDYPETVAILTLDEPACVSGDPQSRLNWRGHARVTEVQLVLSEARARRFLGKRVRATGTLFGARTGHHRTDVLLDVKALRAG